jgi:hypothetical protein
MTGSRFRYHVDEFIENGVSGLTFDQRAADAEAQLGSQLLRLMTDPQLMAALAREGYRAACRFKASAISARMLDDFSSLVSLPHATRPRRNEPVTDRAEPTIRR